MPHGLPTVTDREQITNSVLSCKTKACLESFKRLCRKGQLDEAFHILESQGTHVRVPFVYCLLEGCIRERELTVGRKLHSLVTRCGLSTNAFLGSHLIRLFALCGSLLEANQVFNNLYQPSVFTWSAIITANANLGLGMQAIELYYQMQHSGVTPDGHIYAAVLNACGSVAVLLQGKLVHTQLIENAFESNVVIGNTLIDMYSKCESLRDARRVFDTAVKRDVVTWSALIAGYAQHGYHFEALELFQCMQKKGLKPNTVTWNAIIAGYTQHGHGQKALQFFHQMQDEGMEANVITFVCILKSCSIIESLEKGKQMHAWIIENGFEFDIVIGNAVIDMYAKCGGFEDTCKMFSNMPKRDVVTWSRMIALHAQHGECQEAIYLFQQMHQVGIMPNSVTFVNVLKAYCDIAALHEGKLIHTQITENGLDSNIFVGSSLIDMYTECGSVEDACIVFHSLPKRSAVAWNAIIAGYAQNNNYKVAKHWFEEMQREGLQPSASTFTSLLSACSHVGSLDDGCLHFKSMRDDYKIAPTIDQYNCIIDLLGRVGRLSEAADLLESMPFGTNMIGWKSLLGHCKMHGNLALAKQCFSHVVTIDCEHAMGYVFMSNVYAGAGKWEDASRLEEFKRCVDAWKKPGQAFIEVGNKMHDFMVRDESHPQSDDILIKLRKLAMQVKEKGFMPNLDECQVRN